MWWRMVLPVRESLFAWLLDWRRQRNGSSNAVESDYAARASARMNLMLTRIVVAGVAVLCSSTSISCAQQPAGKEIAPGVREVGRIASFRISEGSGVVASRQFPGIFWTHTDGGGPKKQWLVAMTREGATVKEIFLSDVVIDDWEDIALDDQKHLYIADTGNNDAKRTQLLVHQLDEPNPRGDTFGLRVKQSWRLRFPAAPFDCESLFIWKDHGYVVSKVFRDARAQIYRFPLAPAKEPVLLELVATTKIDSPVTGADISPDGRMLGLVSKTGAFVFPIDGDVSRVIKAKPHQTKFRHEHIEGCTFVPEGLLVTAESREVFLFTDPAFRGEKVVKPTVP